jgi:hypothetical protein
VLRPNSKSEAETPRPFTRGPSSHQTTPSTSARPLPLVASASRYENIHILQLRSTENIKTDIYSPNSLPSKEIIAETVDLYFRYCHRQPLWLFERDDLASLDDCCEEVIFSLLALTVRFSNREFFEGRAQELSHRYAEVARGHIMFRIAQGAVQLSTIQSLCLLALANFVGMACLCPHFRDLESDFEQQKILIWRGCILASRILCRKVPTWMWSRITEIFHS